MTDTLTSNQRVRLLKDIYDDGQDHHPPGYCGRKGEVVLVRTMHTIGVSHEGVDGSEFVVRAGEFEVIPPSEMAARHCKHGIDWYACSICMHPIPAEKASADG